MSSISNFLRNSALVIFSAALLIVLSDHYVTGLHGYSAVAMAAFGSFVAILWIASLVGAKLTIKEPCNVVIGGMFVGLVPTLVGVVYYATTLGKPTIFVGFAMMIAPSVAAMTAKHE